MNGGYIFKTETSFSKDLQSLKLDLEKPFALKEKIVNVDIDKSYVNGDGIKHCTLGKVSKFLIYLVEKDGKPARVNPDSIVVNIQGKEKISYNLKVRSIGCYRIKYKPTSIGDLKITIEIGNAKLTGSPFTVGSESSNVIELKHTSDFDTNGLFYYLGTQQKKKAHDNPMILRLCSVETSSISNFSSKVFSLVDKDPCNFYTQENDPNPSITISIAESGFTFLPTYYCLRNGTGFSESALRNWKFEGSNDKKIWYLIKQHFDDKKIEPKKSSVAGWKVDALEYYLYFKISITGPDAEGEKNLSIGGIEMYGMLKKSKF